MPVNFWDMQKIRELGILLYVILCNLFTLRNFVGGRGRNMKRFGLVSVQYIFYVNLQSFMTCGRSVKEFFLLLVSHKLISTPKPALFYICSPIAIATQLMVYINRRGVT